MQAGIEQQRAYEEQQELQRQTDAALPLLSGELSRPLSVQDVNNLGAAISSRQEGTRASNPVLQARQDRLDAIAQGDQITIDVLRAAFPNLNEDSINAQAVYQATLNYAAGNPGSTNYSIFMVNELRRMGMNPIKAAEWTAWSVKQGFASPWDVPAVAGAIVGGHIGSSVASRFVPVFRTGINPRLTTGVARGAVEEVGEETGELIAEVIARAATGTNPGLSLLDPGTYIHAGGSVGISSILEADRPGGRRTGASPQPEAVPAGQEGNGAVFSTTGEPVDSARVTEGNRLLDRWAASNEALQLHPEDAPPGVDQATWYRRRDSLQRDVKQSGDALSVFRAANPDLVVGYRGGGGGAVVANDNSLISWNDSGEASVYAFRPGDAAFMMTSGEPDARAIFTIDNSGRLVPVRPVGVGGVPGTATVDGSASDSGRGSDSDTLRERDQQNSRADVAEPAVAPSPQIAPVPTAVLSPPLPTGQAKPVLQTIPTPTATRAGRGSSGGKAAPPTPAGPGSSILPTPGSPGGLSPSPQQTPRQSPQPSSTITPTPTPGGPGTQTGTEPGTDPTDGGDPTFQQGQGAPSIGTFPGPTTFPGITPFGQPATFPQPFAIPVTFGQPTRSPSTPATIPDITLTPQPTTDTEPGTQPEPEPSIAPTIPGVTTEPPTRTPTPGNRRIRRRRRGDEDDVRRIEIPNPVADDPNLHPEEVQYVEQVRHTVDLTTGEHTIEPLDDQAMRTAQITGFGPEDPEGNVQHAGSVIIESERDKLVLESTDRQRDAGIGDEDLGPLQLREDAGQPDFFGGGLLTPKEGVSRETATLRQRDGQQQAVDPDELLRRRETDPTSGDSALRPKDDVRAKAGGKATGKGGVRAKAGARLANRPDQDDGLMKGKNRRGGGRRRTPEEEELMNQRPQIIVTMGDR